MTYGTPIGGTSRYLQYKAEFASIDQTKTPILQQVGVCYQHYQDLTPPTITGRSPSPAATEVTLNTNIVVTFSEVMNPATINTDTIYLRVFGTTTDLAAAVSYSGLNAILDPTANLAIGMRYSVVVTGGASGVADLNNNRLSADDTWDFSAFSQGSFTDNTYADFSAGLSTTVTGTYVSETTDGEVILKPTVGTEFSGTSLPDGWLPAYYGPLPNGTPAYSMNGGTITLNATRLYQSTFFSSGRWLEFEATFADGDYQHIGFGDTYSAAPWAIFTTVGTNGPYLLGFEQSRRQRLDHSHE